ncbi:MAG: tRNA pseudouridine(38-40) synthase TruA [Leeuwenhoekiella sp.]
MRYFLDISYNGSPYHGWQRQPNALTVQEEIERALSTLLNRTIAITGAGRTDTGVHAKQIFAHFNFAESWDHDECKHWGHKLNRFLSGAVVINEILPVHPDAHARFDATVRSYEYIIATAKSPFLQEWAYEITLPLDVEAMNTAAKTLLGKQDFKCFSKSNTDVKTYICEITEARWKQDGNRLIFKISADRFLRNMVRAIVGTLLDIGRSKNTPEYMLDVIKSGDRGQAGASVPAKGLYLTAVKYSKEIFI